ncbi:MAG: flippase-like domain-containing protein [Flavobacteriales bacterium]|nr:flippase-like domain-containing protein [Flavobacteriales bacterium]MBP6572993.1 flippase-like domain-containing protein [Flavobacteriales bacterium]
MDRTLIFFFRLAVFAASCAFLYTQALAKDSWLWREAFAASLSWPLAIVMLLALLNWGIEAFKWKLLMRPVEVMPYGNAVRATLAGTSIGLFTPNRSGEFVGRLWFVKPGGRMRAGFATVLGSMAQFTSTMLAGAVAVGVVFWTGAIVPWQGTWIADVMVVVAVFIAAASLLLYFFPRLLQIGFGALPLLRRFRASATILSEFSTREQTHVLGLSLLRYVVFAAQFVVLLTLCCGPALWKEAALAVPLIYLATTLIPTMLLTELGVRGGAAVAILSPWGLNEPGILTACFTLWIINLMLPAAIGSLLLLLHRRR